MSEVTAALLQTVREGLQALAEELAAGKSERLRAVLDFASQFHRYSLGNQVLIRAACPQATHVAGYRTWQKLGYQVRQGERGLRILAPGPTNAPVPTARRRSGSHSPPWRSSTPVS